MKKLFFVIIALAGLTYFGLLPFRANDVSKLLPVETVIVTRDGGRYCVDVGAGVRAVGKTLSEALDRLKEEVSGVLFFQTAEQVIVHEQAAQAVDEVLQESRFRPAAGIYRTPAQKLDAQALSRYLAARHTGLTIGEAQALAAEGEPLRLPRIVPADGGFRVVA